jgi:hypothetical protein
MTLTHHCTKHPSSLVTVWHNQPNIPHSISTHGTRADLRISGARPELGQLKLRQAGQHSGPPCPIRPGYIDKPWEEKSMHVFNLTCIRRIVLHHMTPVCANEDRMCTVQMANFKGASLFDLRCFDTYDPRCGLEWEKGGLFARWNGDVRCMFGIAWHHMVQHRINPDVNRGIVSYH